jgi:hypothetical protein
MLERQFLAAARCEGIPTARCGFQPPMMEWRLLAAKMQWRSLASSYERRREVWVKDEACVSQELELLEELVSLQAGRGMQLGEAARSIHEG